MLFAALATAYVRPAPLPHGAPRHATATAQFQMPELPDLSKLFPPPAAPAAPPPPPQKKEGFQLPDFKMPEVELPDLGAMFAPPEAAPASSEPAEPKPEKDIGEKLFEFFIGEIQEGEVAGLARTAGAADTYPATKTEFAEPVEGDSGDVKLMRPLLKNTNLEFLQLKEVYSSSNPLAGFRPEAFHAGVDRKGPCIVIARTQGGAVCGGYSPKGFAGYGEYRGSIAAFLFTWPDGDTSKPAVKLQKIGGASMACCDEPETGPRFGMDGLTIYMNPGNERMAASKLGPFYERMPDGAASIFNPREGGTTRLKEVKAYVGVWPEGERIPYDGAVPFAIE